MLIIITSVYPDNSSGIGSYTFKLASYLKNNYDLKILVRQNKKVINTKDIVQLKFSIISISRNLKKIGNNKIAILQLPFTGCCFSNLSSIFFSLLLYIRGNEVILVIHEYKNVNLLRRLSISLSSIFSNYLIFTHKNNLFEFSKKFINKKIEFIPIASNISKKNDEYANFRSNTIVSFSLFYRDKHVKESLVLFNSFNRDSNKYNFKLIGSDINNVYYKELLSLIDNSNNKIYKDKEEYEIDELLLNSFLSIQLYNDGASIRRGTLLTMAERGIPIITNKGKFSEDLKQLEGKGIFYINNKSDFKDIIEMLSEDEEFYYKCSFNLIDFAKEFSFPLIAKKYNKVIESFSK